ncbi:MAG: hypothetical protein MZV63_33505 [Marinilabiliales bacterium]|nr:hypothetical protein [Marinilabiliales bacterium]
MCPIWRIIIQGRELAAAKPLTIPDKLCGRDKDVHALLASFKRSGSDHGEELLVRALPGGQAAGGRIRTDSTGRSGNHGGHRAGKLPCHRHSR